MVHDIGSIVSMPALSAPTQAQFLQNKLVRPLGGDKSTHAIVLCNNGDGTVDTQGLGSGSLRKSNVPSDTLEEVKPYVHTSVKK